MAPSRQISRNDGYADQVKKLIPAEVSAGFLAINSSIPLQDSLTKYAVIFFIILIPVCVGYLYVFQEVRSKIQIGFTSLVAFPLWACNIAIDRFDMFTDARFIPAAGLVIVTLVSPLLVSRQAE